MFFIENSIEHSAYLNILNKIKAFKNQNVSFRNNWRT